MRGPLIISTTLLSLLLLSSPAIAETHRFESADGSKSFIGELTGYDAKSNRVSVKIKGKTQRFKLELLSEKDRKYVEDNAERLAFANDISISIDSFTDKYVKRSEDRTDDRVYPSGYNIKLSNRSKQTFENIEVTYTIYYGVQGYLKPERKTEKETGEMIFKSLIPLGSSTQRTKPVEIVSGKLEPVLRNVTRRNPDGSDYVEVVVSQPGGRRKDQLIGCSVSLVIDGEVVNTVTEGKIQLEQKKREF